MATDKELTTTLETTNKRWYESGTIRSALTGIVTVAATAGAYFSIEFDAAELQAGLDKILLGIGGIVTIYTQIRSIFGRLKADTKIGKN